MEYTILFFADQWDTMWRRRQQIAYRLARLPGIRRLVYVEFPLTWPSLWKTVRGRAPEPTRERWARWARRGPISVVDGVHIITPIVPVSLEYPSPVTGLSKLLWARQVRALVERAAANGDRQSQPTILWASHPLAAEFLTTVPDPFVCYDANDRFDRLQGWNTMSEELLRDDETLTRVADLVFTQVTAEADQRRAINRHTYVMPNCVDYDLYEEANGDGGDKPPPADLASIPRPVLGYEGNIDDRLDYDLVCALAAHHPQWSIVFVGPVGPAARPAEVARLGQHANMWLLGRKSYDELPRYVQRFDVCLLPHRVAGLTESQSPLKLFDYLASGRPIVATPVAGLEGFRDHIYVAASPGEFARQVELALREDSPEKTRNRKAAAESNSWKVRVDQMWTLICQRMEDHEKHACRA
jgi:glycosyltransferase involved in cell wall biosynthesis